MRKKFIDLFFLILWIKYYYRFQSFCILAQMKTGIATIWDEVEQLVTLPWKPRFRLRLKIFNWWWILSRKMNHEEIKLKIKLKRLFDTILSCNQKPVAGLASLIYTRNLALSSSVGLADCNRGHKIMKYFKILV